MKEMLTKYILFAVLASGVNIGVLALSLWLQKVPLYSLFHWLWQNSLEFAIPKEEKFFLKKSRT